MLEIRRTPFETVLVEAYELSADRISMPTPSLFRPPLEITPLMVFVLGQVIVRMPLFRFTVPVKIRVPPPTYPFVTLPLITMALVFVRVVAPSVR